MIFKRIVLAILLALGGLGLAEGQTSTPSAAAEHPPMHAPAHNRAQDDLQFEVRFELGGGERALVGEARYTHPLGLDLFDGGVWAVLELETRYPLGGETFETRVRAVLEVDTEFLTPYVAIRADLIGFQHQGLVWEIGVRGGIDLR